MSAPGIGAADDPTFYERAASDDHYGDDATRMAIAEGLQAICYELRTANLIAFRQHVSGYVRLDDVIGRRLELERLPRG